MSLPYGYWIRGATVERRELVIAADVLAGYASCAPAADVYKEAFLSAFQFGADFRLQLEQTRSTRGFAGACWSPWIWIDIDREGDLDAAAHDARRLAAFTVKRYKIEEENLLAFFSGSKGFHVGIPSSLWTPEPSTSFNAVARQFCKQLAELSGAVIDETVFDKVRAFRAPNSRHPRTGLHKRRLSLDELMHLTVDGMLNLAKNPAPFDLPSPGGMCPVAMADWVAAVKVVQTTTVTVAKQKEARSGIPHLNRLTLQFIREGAKEGDRNQQLFSAARNLAESGCPPVLIQDLLTEVARDSGLRPQEVKQTIDNGITKGAKNA